MLYATGCSKPRSDSLLQRHGVFVVAARWFHHEEWSHPDVFLQSLVPGRNLTVHELSWWPWVRPQAHIQ